MGSSKCLETGGCEQVASGEIKKTEDVGKSRDNLASFMVLLRPVPK